MMSLDDAHCVYMLGIYQSFVCFIFRTRPLLGRITKLSTTSTVHNVGQRSREPHQHTPQPSSPLLRNRLVWKCVWNRSEVNPACDPYMRYIYTSHWVCHFAKRRVYRKICQWVVREECGHQCHRMQFCVIVDAVLYICICGSVVRAKCVMCERIGNAFNVTNARWLDNRESLVQAQWHGPAMCSSLRPFNWNAN